MTFSPESDDVILNALEELENVAAVDAAIAEGGEPIPWEQSDEGPRMGLTGALIVVRIGHRRDVYR